eukprot:CAMPEP_0194265640 /NCGR_PEP_ID=MMETSP0169-20130528/814_1 /TAXON_ID=218684 /ORGANISM="Corethron pennatum, Strain L29A3" /LENGTH=1665 /DNA_ID=CAMNT_0039006149 /DNA_START=543 /DNA_END=5540 /DNA_ORIENTATION=+
MAVALSKSETSFSDVHHGLVNTGSKNGIGIILLDLQNEFAKKGGKLHESVSSMIDETKMLEKIPGVVKTARQMGGTIIHASIIMSNNQKFDPTDFDDFSFSNMAGLFTEGTWNSEIIQELKPERQDVILSERTNFSAFEGTQLHSIIEDKGITRLFLMGFLTNVCIEETARAASERFPGMEINILSDGCASKTKVEHFTALSSSIPLYGNVMTCREGIKNMVKGPTVKPDENPDVTPPDRPRILALHGAKSNNTVTKLQLENLRILDEDYDIVYMHGPIKVEEGDADLEGLVHGPFYSWIDPNDDNSGSSLITAVANVLSTAIHCGPFDGVYGFSSGGLVAALAASMMDNNRLREALGTYFPGMRKSIPNLFGPPVIDSSDFSTPPFRFVFLACSASPSDLDLLCRYPGLESLGQAVASIRVPSFHIVGIDDKFKTQSEKIATLFAKCTVAYLNSGHIVGREERSNGDLCSSLKTFLSTCGNSPSTRVQEPYIRMSSVSSISVDPHSQMVNVKLDHHKLPEGLYGSKGGSTIMSLLQNQPSSKPFLYVSRASTNPPATTTYGGMIEFIQNAGNLRQLGVKIGEVVAYAPPPGGGAAAAVAFLSIGAQTAAAPMAPGTTESDALDTLDQFKAKHLILFDGVDCPGVQSAFKKYSDDGNARLHRATITGNDRPGLFKYTAISKFKSPERNILDNLPLKNPEDGTCLLLRTSETTARPKGIPLKQGSVVTNGFIIASSMGLQTTDVCYSVMSLFNIGGISASILCTLASGGSVSCDGEEFDPDRMVDALHLSNPQPTWYSSVPTVHNATVAFLKNAVPGSPKHSSYGIKSDGTWPKGKGHSLRMIRSGGATLLGPDGEALSAAYGGVPIYPTYSMNEQMPISQPPSGKIDTLTDKPGSVGVVVAASTVIVSRSHLRPQPYGVEGEIAISGPTILKKYLENFNADQKSYFYLTLPEINGIYTDNSSQAKIEKERFFLTGDVGIMDKDGFLFLKERAKELIKKGGEQVSPFEVEEKLVDHPLVDTAICFSVPSALYGQEVGCALVLSPNLPESTEHKQVISEMRMWMKGKEFAPVKWPTKWVICKDSELLKTKTQKYIRVGLSTHLGLDPEQDGDKKKEPTKAEIDWGTLNGLRFLLACYVMFMHLGSNESWGAFSNLRRWPWHVHCFFTLGGYSLASPMNPVIRKKLSYFLARIGGMYPMYCIALVFGLVNLLIVCRPSTFRSEFHWDAQPNDLKDGDGNLSQLFCEGTIATKTSYWGSLMLTIMTYLFGFAVTPMWPLSWWLGYYLWFSSMYYQCLAFFPATYNSLYNRTRKKVGLLLWLIIALLVFNVVILMSGWYSFKNYEGYNHYDDTGKKQQIEHYENAGTKNAFVLSFYLFGPFWALYFLIGMCVAFLYDAYHPAERHNAWIWGVIADVITLIMLYISAIIVVEPFYTRPSEAAQFIDSSFIVRLWDNISGRLACPLTTLWIFALSTGRGLTASLLRTRFWSETLAPNSYNCFLFHQMIGQWYYAATRNGHWWNWWRYRKTFYWFSPKPCPVEWYEYFVLVILVVGFSNIMTYVEPFIGGILLQLKRLLTGKIKKELEEGTRDSIFDIIEGMTGIEPHLDLGLEECGLASISIPVISGLLNKKLTKKGQRVTITAAELVGAKTIAEIIEVVDAVIKLADEKGV